MCYSFSKSLSLPGERLGYVLVPGQAADSGEVYAAVAGAGRSLGYVNAPSLFQQVTSLCCDMTADLSVYERNCKLLVPALPYLLGFAAGAMLYVVVEEMIPEMSQGRHSHIGVLAFAAGFSVMMVLDVALG